jgi:tetratricopeptide (TPR) repeat protein
VYAVEGRFDRAVAEMVRLRQVAGQAPRSAGVVLDAFLLEGDYRALWAKQLIEYGRGGEARQQVDQAAAYTRTAELSYPQYNLGLLYLKLDEPEKAKEAFDRFLRLEPEGSRADDVRRIRARLSQPPERSMTH